MSEFQYRHSIVDSVNDVLQVRENERSVNCHELFTSGRR